MSTFEGNLQSKRETLNKRVHSDWLTRKARLHLIAVHPTRIVAVRCSTEDLFYFAIRLSPTKYELFSGKMAFSRMLGVSDRKTLKQLLLEHNFQYVIYFGP